MKNRFSKSTVRLIAALACSVWLIASPALAATGPNALTDLRVSYWPEYDKPSVLLIYRGRVASTTLPATVRLLLPKDALLAATSTVDSNGQFVYDEAWASKKTKTVGDFQELTFETANPEFQAEVYYLNLGNEKQRKLPLLFAAPANIDRLQIEIQEPQRSSNFSIEPATKNVSAGDNFQYYNYAYDNVPAGRELSFNVTYEKSDSNPSVENQQGSVSTPASRKGLTVILLAIAAIIAIGIAAAIWRFRTVAAKNKRPVAKPVKKKVKQQNQQNQKKQANAANKSKFCTDCGEALKDKDSFCPGCGKPV